MSPITITGITKDEEERIKVQLWALLPTYAKWWAAIQGGLRRMPMARLARMVAVHSGQLEM